jgi:hypothetical protein
MSEVEILLCEGGLLITMDAVTCTAVVSECASEKLEVTLLSMHSLASNRFSWVTSCLTDASKPLL